MRFCIKIIREVMSTRMKTLYKSEIKKKMMDKYKYKNVHQIPKLEKIVINCVTS